MATLFARQQHNLGGNDKAYSYATFCIFKCQEVMESYRDGIISSEVFRSLVELMPHRFAALQWARVGGGV